MVSDHYQPCWRHPNRLHCAWVLEDPGRLIYRCRKSMISARNSHHTKGLRAEVVNVNFCPSSGHRNHAMIILDILPSVFILPGEFLIFPA